MKQRTILKFIMIVIVVCTAFIFIMTNKAIYNTRYNHEDTDTDLEMKQRYKYYDEYSFLPKYANPKRYMIYSCDGVCGGLGDRQKGIVAAYLMSLLTNRTFGIIHTKPTPLINFLRPNLLNWDINPNMLKGLTKQHHLSLSDFKFVGDLPNLDLNKFYSKDVIMFRGNIEYVRALRKHYNASKVFPQMMVMTNSDIYFTILKLLFRLSSKLEKDLKQFFNKVHKRKLVCSHIRMGKNPSIPTDIMPKLKTGEIYNIWQFLKFYKNATRFAIFTASDSDEIKNLTKREFPSQFVDIPGKIVHIDQIGYRNEREGLKKMFLEQIVLSKCDVLIITRSGFNRIAAYIRNKSDHLYCFLQGLVVPCRHDMLDQVFVVY